MQKQYDAYVSQVDAALEDCLNSFHTPAGRLPEAMRYSLLSGGKRIRPVILLAFCDAAGGNSEEALPFACALEMIHCYSLIHDDLPCMDNDDFRRGKPANHKVYGEAAALLAGDGLLTFAFETMLNPMPKDPETASRAILSLAQAAMGMIGGQQLELDGSEDLTLVHKLKTGSLFSAATSIGCELSHASDKQRDAAAAYTDCLSRAFQIMDDLLDSDGFVPVIGAEACRETVISLTQEAKKALTEVFNKPEFLFWLADSLAVREL